MAAVLTLGGIYLIDKYVSIVHQNKAKHVRKELTTHILLRVQKKRESRRLKKEEDLAQVQEQNEERTKRLSRGSNMSTTSLELDSEKTIPPPPAYSPRDHDAKPAYGSRRRELEDMKEDRGPQR